MTTRERKSFRVRFCVIDYYSIDICAADDVAAIEQAQTLRGRHA